MEGRPSKKGKRRSEYFLDIEIPLDTNPDECDPSEISYKKINDSLSRESNSISISFKIDTMNIEEALIKAGGLGKILKLTKTIGRFQVFMVVAYTLTFISGSLMMYAIDEITLRPVYLCDDQQTICDYT